MVDAVRTAPFVQLRRALLCVCIAPRLLFSRLKARDLILDRLTLENSVRILRDLRSVHFPAAVRLPKSERLVVRPRENHSELLFSSGQRLPADSSRATDLTVCHQIPTFRLFLG